MVMMDIHNNIVDLVNNKKEVIKKEKKKRSKSYTSMKTSQRNNTNDINKHTLITNFLTSQKILNKIEKLNNVCPEKVMYLLQIEIDKITKMINCKQWKNVPFTYQKSANEILKKKKKDLNKLHIKDKEYFKNITRKNIMTKDKINKNFRSQTLPYEKKKKKKHSVTFSEKVRSFSHKNININSFSNACNNKLSSVQGKKEKEETELKIPFRMEGKGIQPLEEEKDEKIIKYRGCFYQSGCSQSGNTGSELYYNDGEDNDDTQRGNPVSRENCGKGSPFRHNYHGTKSFWCLPSEPTNISHNILEIEGKNPNVIANRRESSDVATKGRKGTHPLQIILPKRKHISDIPNKEIEKYTMAEKKHSLGKKDISKKRSSTVCSFSDIANAMRINYEKRENENIKENGKMHLKSGSSAQTKKIIPNFERHTVSSFIKNLSAQKMLQEKRHSEHIGRKCSTKCIGKMVNSSKRAFSECNSSTRDKLKKLIRSNKECAHRGSIPRIHQLSKQKGMLVRREGELLNDDNGTEDNDAVFERLWDSLLNRQETLAEIRYSPINRKFSFFHLNAFNENYCWVKNLRNYSNSKGKHIQPPWKRENWRSSFSKPISRSKEIERARERIMEKAEERAKDRARAKLALKKKKKKIKKGGGKHAGEGHMSDVSAIDDADNESDGDYTDNGSDVEDLLPEEIEGNTSPYYCEKDAPYCSGDFYYYNCRTGRMEKPNIDMHLSSSENENNHLPTKVFSRQHPREHPQQQAYPNVHVVSHPAANREQLTKKDKAKSSLGEEDKTPLEKMNTRKGSETAPLWRGAYYCSGQSQKGEAATGKGEIHKGVIEKGENGKNVNRWVPNRKDTNRAMSNGKDVNRAMPNGKDVNRAMPNGKDINRGVSNGKMFSPMLPCGRAGQVFEVLINVPKRDNAVGYMESQFYTALCPTQGEQFVENEEERLPFAQDSLNCAGNYVSTDGACGRVSMNKWYPSKENSVYSQLQSHGRSVSRNLHRVQDFMREQYATAKMGCGGKGIERENREGSIGRNNDSGVPCLEENSMHDGDGDGDGDSDSDRNKQCCALEGDGGLFGDLLKDKMTCTKSQADIVEEFSEMVSKGGEMHRMCRTDEEHNPTSDAKESSHEMGLEQDDYTCFKTLCVYNNFLLKKEDHTEVSNNEGRNELQEKLLPSEAKSLDKISPSTHSEESNRNISQTERESMFKRFNTVTENKRNKGKNTEERNNSVTTFTSDRYNEQMNNLRNHILKREEMNGGYIEKHGISRRSTILKKNINRDDEKESNIMNKYTLHGDKTKINIISPVEQKNDGKRISSQVLGSSWERNNPSVNFQLEQTNRMEEISDLNKDHKLSPIRRASLQGKNLPSLHDVNKHLHKWKTVDNVTNEGYEPTTEQNFPNGQDNEVNRKSTTYNFPISLNNPVREKSKKANLVTSTSDSHDDNNYVMIRNKILIPKLKLDEIENKKKMNFNSYEIQEVHDSKGKDVLKNVNGKYHLENNRCINKNLFHMGNPTCFPVIRCNNISIHHDVIPFSKMRECIDIENSLSHIDMGNCSMPNLESKYGITPCKGAHKDNLFTNSQHQYSDKMISNIPPINDRINEVIIKKHVTRVESSTNAYNGIGGAGGVRTGETARSTTVDSSLYQGGRGSEVGRLQTRLVDASICTSNGSIRRSINGGTAGGMREGTHEAPHLRFHPHERNVTGSYTRERQSGSVVPRHYSKKKVFLNGCEDLTFDKSNCISSNPNCTIKRIGDIDMNSCNNILQSKLSSSCLQVCVDPTSGEAGGGGNSGGVDGKGGDDGGRGNDGDAGNGGDTGNGGGTSNGRHYKSDSQGDGGTEGETGSGPPPTQSEGERNPPRKSYTSMILSFFGIGRNEKEVKGQSVKRGSNFSTTFRKCEIKGGNARRQYGDKKEPCVLSMGSSLPFPTPMTFVRNKQKKEVNKTAPLNRNRFFTPNNNIRFDNSTVTCVGSYAHPSIFNSAEKRKVCILNSAQMKRQHSFCKSPQRYVHSDEIFHPNVLSSEIRKKEINGDNNEEPAARLVEGQVRPYHVDGVSKRGFSKHLQEAPKHIFRASLSSKSHNETLLNNDAYQGDKRDHSVHRAHLANRSNISAALRPREEKNFTSHGKSTLSEKGTVREDYKVHKNFSFKNEKEVPSYIKRSVDLSCEFPPDVHTHLVSKSDSASNQKINTCGIFQNRVAFTVPNECLKGEKISRALFAHSDLTTNQVHFSKILKNAKEEDNKNAKNKREDFKNPLFVHKNNDNNEVVKEGTLAYSFKQQPLNENTFRKSEITRKEILENGEICTESGNKEKVEDEYKAEYATGCIRLGRARGEQEEEAISDVGEEYEEEEVHVEEEGDIREDYDGEEGETEDDEYEEEEEDEVGDVAEEEGDVREDYDGEEGEVEDDEEEEEGEEGEEEEVDEEEVDEEEEEEEEVDEEEEEEEEVDEEEEEEEEEEEVDEEEEEEEEEEEVDEEEEEEEEEEEVDEEEEEEEEEEEVDEEEEEEEEEEEVDEEEEEEEEEEEVDEEEEEEEEEEEVDEEEEEEEEEEEVDEEEEEEEEEEEVDEEEEEEEEEEEVDEEEVEDDEEGDEVDTDEVEDDEEGDEVDVEEADNCREDVGGVEEDDDDREGEDEYEEGEEEHEEEVDVEEEDNCREDDGGIEEDDDDREDEDEYEEGEEEHEEEVDVEEEDNCREDDGGIEEDDDDREDEDEYEEGEEEHEEEVDVEEEDNCREDDGGIEEDDDDREDEDEYEEGEEEHEEEVDVEEEDNCREDDGGIEEDDDDREDEEEYEEGDEAEEEDANDESDNLLTYMYNSDTRAPTSALLPVLPPQPLVSNGESRNLELSYSENPLEGKENYHSSYYMKSDSLLGNSNNESRGDDEIEVLKGGLVSSSRCLDSVYDKNIEYTNLSTKNASSGYIFPDETEENSNFLNDHNSSMHLSEMGQGGSEYKCRSFSDEVTSSDIPLRDSSVDGSGHDGSSCKETDDNRSYKYLDEITKQMKCGKKNNEELKKKLQEQILIQRGLLRIKEQQQVYLELLKRNDRENQAKNTYAQN
ncbi:conserved Plasmodium protein, unknown function [Plasmodium ovale]|uniref:Uncharacterized protein n=1 Tax=Plasmodium ovale TaxID=36330 RepID=A0A1D3U8W5_PLAOA|nr:conserved Plasmodium protein, unknown function [Plasmodium ovale]